MTNVQGKMNPNFATLAPLKFIFTVENNYHSGTIKYHGTLASVRVLPISQHKYTHLVLSWTFHKF